MKQKITRKDLKRNELAETMGRTVDYVSTHRRGVTEGVVIAACAVALVAGIFLYRAYRESAAGRELSAALEALDTPVGPQVGGASRGRTFATVAEQDREADRHLQAAAAYGGTAAGRAASVIRAARNPQASTVSDALAKAARDRNMVVAAAGELGLAVLLVASVKTT
jgi:hypothetical protein